MGKVVFYTEDHVEHLVDRLRYAKKQLMDLKEVHEAMRPHWAKGYTSDSMAAQAQTAALAQVWQLLGVDNQTACMQKLRELVGVPA